MDSAKGQEASTSYQLLIEHGGSSVPIEADDDAEAIARAWTYVLDCPAITAATLQANGRLVSYLSR